MKYQTRAFLSHVGIIASNLSIFLLIYSVCAFFSGILGFFIPLIGFIAWGGALVFSIGLLMISPEFRAIPEQLMNLLSSIGEISNVLMVSMPIAIGVGAGLSLLSTIFLLFEPSSRKHYGRISITVIIFVALIAILVGIILTATGGV